MTLIAGESRARNVPIQKATTKIQGRQLAPTTKERIKGADKLGLDETEKARIEPAKVHAEIERRACNKIAKRVGGEIGGERIAAARNKFKENIYIKNTECDCTKIKRSGCIKTAKRVWGET